MARTGNQILETVIGQMLMRDASMVAAFEALREQYDALTKEFEALKAAQTIPPTGEKMRED